MRLIISFELEFSGVELISFFFIIEFKKIITHMNLSIYLVKLKRRIIMLFKQRIKSNEEEDFWQR